MPGLGGYNSLYNGDIHAVPTSRYDAVVQRRPGDHHHHHRGATITTYNVTKDPVTRSASVRDHSRTRHRSSTFDSGAVKPIIVTTNHSRPHNSGSHVSGSSRRLESPIRNPYRSSEEVYYAQPASSIRSRSHQRHNSATYDREDIYRMRERVSGGDDRLRAPPRPLSRQSMYGGTPRTSATEFVEDYEYTKPSDLARYDLDHERPRSRTSRRDSFDRGANYYRPPVSVVNNETIRPDRGRARPPTSIGLERYNRNAAAGIYDRPTIAMPALPAVPPPPADYTRRSSIIDAPPSPSVERRSSKARPVSLYQDPSPRVSQVEDLYRSHDDEHLHRDHRERERANDIYRNDVTARGFGIRPELLEQAELRRPLDAERRENDDYRPRREYEEREPKRRSDEDLEKARGRHERRPSEVRDRPVRVEESKERKDSKSERMREKVAAGLGAAAAAIGIAPLKDREKEKEKEKEKEEKEVKISPRRRRDSEIDPEPSSTRITERYRPTEGDVERKPSPREEPIVVEQRREATKERSSSRDGSGSQERERNRRDPEAQISGLQEDTRDNSPYSDDSASAPSRRRRHPSTAFNPTDTKGLMDLKAQLAAMEDHERSKDKEKEEREKEREREKDRETPSFKERIEAESAVSSGSERQSTPSRSRDRSMSRDGSRGRDMVLVDSDSKQVRVVSPPRDKQDQKPIKGILKQPTSQFPEEPNPVREGVAPHKDDKTKKDVPLGARWTKVSRRIINPEALTVGKERFEVRDDFVIVLRVLSKEEIQAYATATAQLRGK